MGRKDSIPDDAPAPRLCVLSKWEHFQGYGFNLHSEKGKEGQFIGKIDPASPAEACGLQEGDQIIEVNGVNTSNENHKQVVQRIKTDPEKVQLLVVDPAAAEYYKKCGVVVKGSMANVKRLQNAQGSSDQEQETGNFSAQAQHSDESGLAIAALNGNDDAPPPIPPKNDVSLQPVETTVSKEDTECNVNNKTKEDKVPAEEKPAEEADGQTEAADLPLPPPTEDSAGTAASPGEKPSHDQDLKTAYVEESPESENGKSESPETSTGKEQESTKEESPRIDTTLQVESGSDRAQPSPAPSADSTGTVESAKSAKSAKSAESGGEAEDKFGLKLNMTAAEMKEYLKSKKRPDPRNDNLTFKQRHAIVSNM